MIKRAALALLLLSACTPEAEAPKEAVVAPETTPVVEVPAPAPEKTAPAGEIKVDEPISGARIRSPLIATGTADNTWYFEGQFAAKLEINGKTMIEAPAMQNDPDKAWTDPGPVKFKVEMKFTVSEPTEAVLVLSEDMPAPEGADSDVNGPAKTVRIPVTLVPTPER